MTAPSPLLDAPGLARVAVERPGSAPETDWVAVEEPLQIRVDGQPLAVTMRTPGHDRELAVGFLLTEGVIDGPADVESVHLAKDVFESSHPENAVDVRVRPGRVDGERLERAGRDFRAVSSCGVCGKRTIDSLRQTLPPIAPLDVPLARLRPLPEAMRSRQCLFEVTGGIHAAALFDPEGRLEALFEDIGRHNAVDKVIGDAVLRGRFPLSGRILVTSGRAGFEVVQKALRGGIPVLASVGAASSLAVDLAREAGLALYAFVGPESGHRHV